MKKSIAAAITAATLLSPIAHADYYITGTLAQTTPDDKLFKSDNGIRLGFGTSINENFSVEINYGSLGSFAATDEFNNLITLESENALQQLSSNPNLRLSSSTTSVEFTAIEIALIGSMPVSEKASIYGRLALANWDTEFDVRGVIEVNGESDSFKDSSGSLDGTDLSVGLGAKLAFNEAISGHFEVNQYKLKDLKVRLIGLGLSYKF